MSGAEEAAAGTGGWPGSLLGDEFRGRRVLVTGGSRGIGAAVALAFGQLGAAVAVHAGTDLAAAEAVAGRVRHLGGTAVPLVGDFTRSGEAEAAVDRAADALGGLDVLVNNAGTMMGRVPLAEITDEHMARVLALNVGSVVAASRRALPALRASRGAIVSTSSISARTGGSPGSSLYSGAKAFVATFTRSLATELAPDGIRVNAVSPGTVATDFHRRYSTPEKLAATAARIPLGRVGEAGDCVGAYLFLASPRLAGYVTGQVIEVNGGQFMG